MQSERVELELRGYLEKGTDGYQQVPSVAEACFSLRLVKDMWP